MPRRRGRYGGGRARRREEGLDDRKAPPPLSAPSGTRTAPHSALAIPFFVCVVKASRRPADSRNASVSARTGWLTSSSIGPSTPRSILALYRIYNGSISASPTARPLRGCRLAGAQKLTASARAFQRRAAHAAKGTRGHAHVYAHVDAHVMHMSTRMIFLKNDTRPTRGTPLSRRGPGG